MPRLTRFHAILRIAMLAVVAWAVVPSAPAQMRGMMGGPGMSGALDPAFTTRDLTRYADALNLSQDQRDAATELLGGYQAEHAVIAGEMREAIEAATEEFRDTRDFSVWEDIRPKRDAFRTSAAALEASLMTDLQALLTEEQTARWPAIERARRRDTSFRRSFVSGEALDVTRLVDDLRLSPEARAQLAPQLDPLLEQYAADVDRALVERNALYDQAMNNGFALWRNQDMEGMTELFTKGREAAIALRDINRRYARQVEAALPEDLKATFQARVQEASFPRVYRESAADTALAAAKAFPDLTADQRAALDTLSAQHARDAAQANARWAKAQETSEEQASMMQLLMGAGGPGGGGGGGGAGGGGTEDVRAARQTRRDIDSKALDQLNQLLTPEQKAKLPERRARDGEGEGDRPDGPRRRPRAPANPPTS